MKKIYWRPKAVSQVALVLIAGLSLVGLAVVELVPMTEQRPYYQEKLAASELAARAMEQIYYARLEQGPEIDASVDPAQSGLIGVPMSPVTSVSGDLVSKQTSINPNFAAILVEMLRRSGVKAGDAVAVGCSGSFPALNICVYAALETLNVKPLAISSAAGSQWGANVPGLLWIDMERILAEKNIFTIRSLAVSPGGFEDRGLGLSDQGLQMIQEAIDRNGLPRIGTDDFQQNIEQRMQIYYRNAGRHAIRAYINVGGGTVSVGRSIGKHMFHPGLNQRAPKHLYRLDGVMPRFMKESVPVIHLVQIPTLAEQHGLPLTPNSVPEVGEAPIFIGTTYNPWLAGATLVIILATLYGFIRSDVGFRLLRVSSPRRDRGYPEPMI